MDEAHIRDSCPVSGDFSPKQAHVKRRFVARSLR
jgi:hypothetical protein